MIKIYADDSKAAVLTKAALPDTLKICREAIADWGWEAWVETYPEESDDGSLKLFRIVMGPVVRTHPSFYFTRFYGGVE